ncbi:hypothetical protein SERLA73DRAFT_76340 [Serpula lacrymans var. lacrymans S7.3]|uniref:Nephrocystin 3-like N-terminal domain-containing protein n=2 Tax=Serpula lacrymans var. lacrymans TaxID=341189 RepID=F8Q6Y7_SERL3|nr:uncharacterized protein SERLADRAFT_441134 [Serpula lacrymans var. lacrymans S7.9]EGN96375.1 hypothetical protein SERLA73DRAFT_76340 [Serpula lacrymans var. lacrymans S7.3]EGO21913.1 hypothetical protein SERLADRAFT_441134 [Serpula lacrymans var. lacrymans S7.9]
MHRTLGGFNVIRTRDHAAERLSIHFIDVFFWETTCEGSNNLNQHPSPAPPAGLLNWSNNARLQDCVLTDFGSAQHVEQNINNNNRFYRAWSLSVLNSKLNHSRSAVPSLYDIIHPVQASYKDRSGKLARCLEGTRKEVLNEIKSWTDGTLPICWLNGFARSGKSTIAQSVAEWCASEGRLAASFFFFRGTGNRDKISHLISTLAFQLSTTVENMELLIRDALDKEPFLTQQHTPLSYQFDKLIMTPMLSHARSTFTQNNAAQKCMVIVIDALDECEVGDGESMDEFIDAVIDACKSKGGRVPFRLFITSRVEEHLRLKLETIDAKKVSLQLKLQHYDARKDIRMFFQSEFADIYAANRLLMVADGVPEPWPSWDVLNTLVGEANGSYIYASTFVKFVRQAGGMAHQQLLEALKAHGLDPLYIQVFSSAVSSEVAPGSVVDLKWAMGTLLHLEKQLSIRDLALLMDVPPRNLVRSFLGIQSILLIPEADDRPVHLVHTSLRDFLTTESRSAVYFTNPSDCHASITKNCLYHLWQAVDGWESYHSESSLSVSLSRSLTDFATNSNVFASWVYTIIRDGPPRQYLGMKTRMEVS